MMRALWLRLGRVWGWQRAEKPKPKARECRRAGGSSLHLTVRGARTSSGVCFS